MIVPSGSPKDPVLDLRTVPIQQRKAAIKVISENWIAKNRRGQEDISQLTGVIFDWMGVAKIAQEYLSRNKGSWIFRGQSFPHPLRPKIGRPNARKDPTGKRAPKYKTKDEKWILTQFKARGRPYLNFDPNTDLEWLAVAQHHDCLIGRRVFL